MPGGTPMSYPFPYKTGDGQGLALGAGTVPGTVIIAGSTSTQIGTAPPGTPSITNIYSSDLNTYSTNNYITTSNNYTSTSNNTTITSIAGTTIDGSTTTVSGSTATILGSNSSTTTIQGAATTVAGTTSTTLGATSSTTIIQGTTTNIAGSTSTTVGGTSSTTIIQGTTTNVAGSTSTTLGGTSSTTIIQGTTTNVAGSTSTTVGSSSSPTTIDGSTITFSGPVSSPYFNATDSFHQYRTSHASMDFYTTVGGGSSTFNFLDATGSYYTSRLHAQKFTSQNTVGTLSLSSNVPFGNPSIGDLIFTSTTPGAVLNIENQASLGFLYIYNYGYLGTGALNPVFFADATNNIALNFDRQIYLNSKNYTGTNSVLNLNQTAGDGEFRVTSNATTLFIDALNVSINASQLIGGTILMTGADINIVSNLFGGITMTSQLVGSIDFVTAIGSISNFVGVGDFVATVALGAISLTSLGGFVTLDTVLGTMTLTTQAGIWTGGSLAGAVNLTAGAGLLTVTSLTGALALTSVVGVMTITAGGLMTISALGGLTISAGVTAITTAGLTLTTGATLLSLGAVTGGIASLIITTGVTTLTTGVLSVSAVGYSTIASTLANTIQSDTEVIIEIFLSEIVNVSATRVKIYEPLEIQGGLAGSVTINAPTPITSYNFNLPTTAGTIGQVLVSGGGGAADMGWTSSPPFVSATFTSSQLATVAPDGALVLTAGGMYIDENLIVYGEQDIGNSNICSPTTCAIYTNSTIGGMIAPMVFVSTALGGFADPPLTGTTRSTGTRIIFDPNQSAGQCDYAIGMDTNSLWYNAPTGASHAFYINSAPILVISSGFTANASPFIAASNLVAALPAPGTASLVTDGGIFVAENAIVNGSQDINNDNATVSTNCALYIPNGSIGASYPLVFGHTVLSAPPLTGIIRSAGTKIILYPEVGVTTCDYALGVDSAILWYNVPVAAAHHFCVNSVTILTIDVGNSTFDTSTQVVIQNNTASSSPTTGALVVSGGIGVAGTSKITTSTLISATNVTIGAITSITGVTTIVGATDITGLVTLHTVGAAALVSLKTLSTLTASTSSSASIIASGGIFITDNVIIDGGENIGNDNIPSATTCALLLTAGSIGMTDPMIFSSAAGSGVPLSGTTRSTGTRTILYPNQSGGQCDYALGIASNTLWYNVPTGASHNFYIDSTSIATISSTKLTVIPTTSSTSTTTGSATFAGGVGIAGALYVTSANITGSGTTLTVTSTTASTSTTTGSATFAGGVGIAGALYAPSANLTGSGTTLTVDSTTTSTSGTTGSAIFAGGVGINGNLVVSSTQSLGNGNVVSASTSAAYLINGIGINGLISWPTSGASFAVPLAGTTRSGGTRIILYPNQVASNCDYAIGIASANMWFSVPTTATFHFYITAVDTVSISATLISSIVPLQFTGTGYLNFSGSTSGLVSIKQQAIAGTYNFNLPTTAGTSGQYLVSGGGGSAPMTWASLGTFTQVAATSTNNANNSTASIYTPGGASVGLDLYVNQDLYIYPFNNAVNPFYYEGDWNPHVYVLRPALPEYTLTSYAFRWYQCGKSITFTARLVATYFNDGSSTGFYIGLKFPTTTVAGQSYTLNAQANDCQVHTGASSATGFSNVVPITAFSFLYSGSYYYCFWAYYGGAPVAINEPGGSGTFDLNVKITAQF